MYQQFLEPVGVTAADLQPGDIAASQIGVVIPLSHEMRHEDAFGRALDQYCSVRKEKIAVCGLEVPLDEYLCGVAASKYLRQVDHGRDRYRSGFCAIQTLVAVCTRLKALRNR